jgi:hypothetical protein
MAKASPTCKDALSGGGGGNGGGGGAGGGGGFAMTPEMQAAREAMHKACDADTKKLCPGQQGREAMACLRDNSAKATAACQAALAKMPSRPPGGGGGGGGGGGFAGGASGASSGIAGASPVGGGYGAAAPVGGAGGAAPGGGGGGGSFTMTPEMQAARDAMRKACDADTKKLCPGLEGREAVMCLRENTAKAGAACQAAMAKMPHRPPGGGGGGQ